ncbi:patatin-like phospholipase family protein [Tropicimonas isoalkanivorans]|uniref:NTE family protein n=1 Tax=Tropicimonas isoalkanivorans TaxID=441112 RepID=A0A1I1DD90_9RHOB|nr:patatin-like phospholipase family protein [Tropicimonas isoalkanivorans]SFB71028.1 NTE family protein [Tropicimonas isoalkanivorans]
MGDIKRINLALQGGGAHGAFTWGVLDRLLDEEDVEIAAISGTSAGALNGAALKAGLVADGEGRDREAARANLDWLWQQVLGVNDFRMTHWFAPFAPPTTVFSQLTELSPFYGLMDLASRVFSPYSSGPFYSNPLERIVSRFEYGKVCAHVGPSFYVAATNVRTGKIRVFSGSEIDTRSILASGCLPTLFRAIEIPDPATGTVEAYWDGGYTGNPPLYPMFRHDLPADIVVVNINPLERPEVPCTPMEIQNRINEISFNSSLLREMRAIQFVHDLVDQGVLDRGQMRDPLIHMIADDDFMRDLSVATKIVPSAIVIYRLKAAGRAAADRFLAEHKQDLNVRETVNLQSMFG